VQIDTDGDGVSDGPQTVFAPNSIGYNPIQDDIERQAIAAGFQAKLTPNLELMADAAFTSNDRESLRNRALVLFARTYGGVTPAENVTIDENGVYQRYDLSDQLRSPLLRTQPLLFNNKTENFIGGINLRHTGDRLTQSFDMYYSDVDYEQDLRFSFLQKNNWDQTGVVYDNLGRDVPTITGLGDNFLDPAGFQSIQGTVREIYTDGDQTGLAYDLDYELGDGFLSSIEAGLRYSETNLDTIRTPAVRVTNADSGLTNAEAGAAALVDPTFETGFLDSISGFEPSSWIVPDFDTLGANQTGLFTLSGIEDLGIDPLASYGIEEDILSGYVQGRIASQLGGIPMSGNLGVRVVQTSQGSTGFAIGDGITGDPQPVEFDNDFTNVLPTLNLKFDVSDQFVVRPSVGRTMSRADYSNLSPRLQVGAVGDDSLLDDTDPEDDATLRRAQAGNPELDPILAWNYDLTFEYYPADHTAFVFSLFYKDVSDFIIRQTTQTTLPGFGDEEFLVNQPVNFSKGSAEGFEVGVVSDFTFLPAPFDKTGVQANYTYVSSEFDEDVGDAGFGFPGSSENNFNIGAYYEGEKLTLRAAYTYRDDYFRLLAGQGAQTGNARFTEGSERLNLSARYKILSNVVVGITAQNVTEEPRRDFVGSETNFLDYFNTGSSVNLSLRASF
jgi:TonB-dependent receptor